MTYRPNASPSEKLLPLWLLLAALSFALLAPGAARAQGFGVYEHGTCEMGRGGASVARPCNAATALLYNPAAVAGSEGFTVSGGLTVIAAAGTFTSDRSGAATELQNDPIPVPHLYAQYGAGERLGVGLGVFVPYGLGSRWPVENFEGRYLGYDNELQSVYVQPTLAYQLTGRLSVGAGLNVVLGSVKLTRRIDLSGQTASDSGTPADPSDDLTFAQLGIPAGTDFGNVELAGRGTGVGAHVGVRFEATRWLDVGARLLTPVTVSYAGEADFEQVPTGIELAAGNPFGAEAGTPLDAVVAGTFQDGPLADQDVETEITLPAQLVGGVAVQATPQLLLLMDYQWTGWSSFESLPLDFEEDALDTEQVEDYEDTHAVRLGAEYAASGAFTLRAGYLTHGAAAPDKTVTPLLPEAHRNEFTLGLGWQPSAAFRLDAAYQYIAQKDRRGRVTELGSAAFDPEVDNDGLYSFGAHLFGTTATLRF